MNRVAFKLRFGNLKLTNEVKDIIVSVGALTIAFSIWVFRSSRVEINIETVSIVIATSILSVTTAFLLHELAHRYVARRFGGYAFFKMWPLGVLLAIVTSFLGFIFAAPGAVNIGGIYRNDHIGKTALAGPATNLILGIVLYLTSFLFSSVSVAAFMLGFAGSINLFLALFNMIPIPPLDGSKIWKWDFHIFVLVFAVALLLNVLDHFI